MRDISNECDNECVSKGLCEHDEICLTSVLDKQEMQNLIEQIRTRERKVNMTYEEAIDIIKTIKDVGYFTNEGNEAFDKAIEALKKETMCNEILNDVSGEWLIRDSMKGGYAYLTCDCGKRHIIRKPESTPVYTCSLCGFGDYVSVQPYKYCPECGAKMDELRIVG